MILFAMIRRRDSFITQYLVKILVRSLPCLHLLCLTFIQAHTSSFPMTFMHIGSEHDPQSQCHLLIHTMSLFISGIRNSSLTSGTPRILLGTPERVALIRGHRPTQAKSLSLGEYMFLTDIIFMFTYHSICRCSHFFIVSSMLNLFSCFLLVCLNNLKKNQKKQLQLLASLLSMLVVVMKRKPKKISRSSFACSELSRVNSFISFLSFGGREEKTIMKMFSGSHMHDC